MAGEPAGDRAGEQRSPPVQGQTGIAGGDAVAPKLPWPAGHFLRALWMPCSNFRWPRPFRLVAWFWGGPCEWADSADPTGQLPDRSGGLGRWGQRSRSGTREPGLVSSRIRGSFAWGCGVGCEEKSGLESGRNAGIHGSSPGVPLFGPPRDEWGPGWIGRNRRGRLGQIASGRHPG